jgi:type I restriction enzyme S subunit
VPFCKIEPDQIEKYSLREGDIVFARTGGTVGKSYIISGVPEAAVFASYLIRLTAHPAINPRFLYHFFQSASYWEQIGLKKGGLQGNVNATTLSSLVLPLCPTNEQRRIVAKIEELFSELDKGVESLTTARKQFKAYRQSILKHAFEGKLTAEWRVRHSADLEPSSKLADQIERERDARFQIQVAEWNSKVEAFNKRGLGERPSKPRRPPEPERPSPEQISKLSTLPDSWAWMQLGSFAFVTKLAGFEYTDFVQYDDSGDLPVIKAENAGPNGYRKTEYSRVRSEAVAALTRSFLSGGELLMVFVGAGTGNVAVVPNDQAYFLGPNIGMMRVETGLIEPRYVELFLRSPLGKELALCSLKAVAQPSLSMGTIRQIPVAIPSFAEQKEIVSRLDLMLAEVDKSEAEIGDHLRRASALRHSILRSAFSGQLVPQDSSDEPASVCLGRIRAERDANASMPKKTTKRTKGEAA